MRFLSDEKTPSFGFCSSIVGLHSHVIVPHFAISTLPCLDHDSTMYTRNITSGACVRLAEEQDISLDALTFEQLQNIDSRFEEDVMKVWDYEMSVERKSSIGGTSKARVLEQIEKCLAYARTL
jgi:hypothetical protein